MAEEELAKKYNISAFPTIKFFRKGLDTINYKGQRESEDIVNWVIKKAGPAVIQSVSSIDEAEALIESQDVVVMGFFKDRESKNAKIFLEIGSKTTDYAFGISDNDEVFSQYGVDDGQVLLFKQV